MNIDAWQAQQKAQKDEERKRKTQAAEALRNYKGDAASNEATLIAQMKEQERQQKLEAEKQLRDYRGIVSAEDTKLAAMKEDVRRKKQEAANLLRGYQGSLSEEEAKMAAIREEERRKKQEAQQELYKNLEATQDKTRTSEFVTHGSVSAMKGVFNIEYSEDDLPSPANSTPEKKHDFFDPQAKVRFKFGLISVGKSSPADGYLEAIDQIVTKVLGEETKQTMGFGYPSISKVENDSKYVSPEGREDVFRRLITVMVPFQGTDSTSTEETKDRIVEALKVEFQQGSFRKVF